MQNNIEREICERRIEKVRAKAMYLITIGTVLGALAGTLLR